MSALAEALVAAQRRALAQLEKEFVRGPQASEIIDGIAKGTFELEKYWVPF